ncbi:MAG: hypothetical protein AAFO73_09315 [Pseudomonadota bacterium]
MTPSTADASSLDQLKKIRAEALARIRASQDYKLAERLGALLKELGGQVDQAPDLAIDVAMDGAVENSASVPASAPATPRVETAAKPSVSAAISPAVNRLPPKAVAPIAPVVAPTPTSIQEAPAIVASTNTQSTIDNSTAIIDELAAEIENDMARLDQANGAVAAAAGNGTVKPFLTKPPMPSETDAKSGTTG